MNLEELELKIKNLSEKNVTEIPSYNYNYGKYIPKEIAWEKHKAKEAIAELYDKKYIFSNRGY